MGIMKIRMETERLILRDVDPEKDFDAFSALMGDTQSMRYMGGAAMSPAHAWRAMAGIIGHQQIRGYSLYSAIDKASGAWVGRVGHWNPLGWRAPEVGWAIHPAHTRKGFATEAARACVDYAFDVLQWDQVVHVIHHENVASMKTAAKIGSRKIEEIQGIPAITDALCFVYGQDKEK